MAICVAEFEVERVGGELRRFGVSGSPAPFEVVSPFEPSGDQPQAIASLVQGVRDGDRYQVLLGVTGSGKTFTMAKTIEALGKPTLVMAPNKTLAAQLASELKEFFPNNAVVYFVSYYDYYQPEAYVPSSDTYIEKDSSINEEVEMLRHQATASLLSRRDVIVVASVSCIYGIGSPEDYAGLAPLRKSSRHESRSLRRTINCSKRSAWSSARAMISRCSKPWDSRPALRTIHDIWMVANRASPRSRL